MKTVERQRKKTAALNRADERKAEAAGQQKSEQSDQLERGVSQRPGPVQFPAGGFGGDGILIHLAPQGQYSELVSFLDPSNAATPAPMPSRTARP
ncbi:hypothetical protein SDC9_130582 [bioreactor metagenome]|uniref:Uncharacterized protein n=1 Tax=bioreactor metagenome TaxID=1076179 RepID=A0A645D371_9ZZZZ